VSYEHYDFWLWTGFLDKISNIKEKRLEEIPGVGEARKQYNIFIKNLE